MITNDRDKELLALLSANSRQTIAELARKLKLSRSTVKDRIERLEKTGVIAGYSVRLSEEYEEGRIRAHVLINVDAKKAAQVVAGLKQVSAVRSLYAVNGVYDMIAMLTADSTKELDSALDQIGNIDGIEKTLSSIILSTKFEG